MPKKLRVQLKEILSISLMGDAEILAGKNGIENEITSVNVMEVPDIIDWVRPGEFLLTTAYPLSTNIETLNSLIPMLKSRGVCGLGIKTKRYIDQVPEEVLNTANKLDFPIIRLPQEASFGDLIREILSYIVGEQTRLLEQINAFSDQVKAIMFQRGGMDEFARLIFSVVRSPLVITDDIFNRHTFYAGSEEWEAKLKNIVEKAVWEVEKAPAYSLNKVRVEQDVIDGENVRRITITTLYDNMQYGKIIIWDVDKRVTDGEIFTIQSESSLIALNTITRITIAERENVHRTNFIEQLLSEDPEIQGKAIADADFFNFRPDLEHQCIVLSLNKAKEKRTVRDDACLVRLISTVMLRIDQQLQRSYQFRYISANKSSEMVFVIDFENYWNDNNKEHACNQFTELLYTIAKREKVEDLAYIGVGTRVSDNLRLNESYLQAKHVVKVLENSNSNGMHIGSYEDLGLLKLFGQPELRKQFLEYADSILAPVYIYDENKHGQLLLTIKAYFDCGGNLKDVSEKIFTHYNTIVYRMNRIRDVLKIDLRDPETAFNIQLALRIKEILV